MGTDLDTTRESPGRGDASFYQLFSNYVEHGKAFRELLASVVPHVSEGLDSVDTFGRELAAGLGALPAAARAGFMEVVRQSAKGRRV